MIARLLRNSTRSAWGVFFWICIAAYALQCLVPGVTLLGITSREALAQGRVWTLLTNGFLHGGLMHIACNMVALVMFAGLEDVLGRKRYVALMLGSIVAGSLLFDLTCSSPALGISGGLAGLFAFYALLRPKARFLLFFVIPCRADCLFYGSIAFSILAWFFHWQPGVAHMAHLGGMLTGTAFYMQHRWSTRSLHTPASIMSEDELRQELRDAYGENF